MLPCESMQDNEQQNFCCIIFNEYSSSCSSGCSLRFENVWLQSNLRPAVSPRVVSRSQLAQLLTRHLHCRTQSIIPCLHLSDPFGVKSFVYGSPCSIFAHRFLNGFRHQYQVHVMLKFFLVLYIVLLFPLNSMLSSERNQTKHIPLTVPKAYFGL